MDELLNGTMADAVEKLAELAAYHRTGPVVKTAAPEWLTSLGETVKANPGLSHALVGGGLGAAALGANTALNNRGQDPAKKKSVLGSMFAGGLAGAGAGAGVGLARQGLSDLKNPGGGISGTDALKPGQFTDPATGQRMAIDPKALKDHPELHAQVKQLTTPSLQSQVAGGIGGVLQGIKDKTPTTAPWVGAAMAGDALLHNPLFGLSRIRPQQAGGQIGKELFQQGIEGDKNLSDALRKGINVTPSTGPAPTSGTDTHVQLNDKVNPSGWLRRNWEGLKGKLPGFTANQPTLGDTLGGRGGSVDGARPVATISYTPEVKGEKMIKDPTTGEYHKTEDHGHGPRTSKTIREADVAQAKFRGYKADDAYKDRQLYRTLGRTYAGAKSLPAALGVRALAYGAPLGAEYVYRGLQEDEQNKQTMRDIMARYAKPVPTQGGK